MGILGILYSKKAEDAAHAWFSSQAPECELEMIRTATWKYGATREDLLSICLRHRVICGIDMVDAEIQYIYGSME